MTEELRRVHTWRTEKLYEIVFDSRPLESGQTVTSLVKYCTPEEFLYKKVVFWLISTEASGEGSGRGGSRNGSGACGFAASD